MVVQGFIPIPISNRIKTLPLNVGDYIMNKEWRQLFMDWMMSDNVIRVENSGKRYWASQDAQYNNRMYTMLDAWNYYQKEFINQ